MKLDHTIVPCMNKERTAGLYADILGLINLGVKSHFTAVKVNDDLTLLFDHRDVFEPHHYAFRVSTKEFEAIMARIKQKGIPFGSGPANRSDGKMYDRENERGFYFDDENGHVLEVIVDTA